MNKIDGVKSSNYLINKNYSYHPYRARHRFNLEHSSPSLALELQLDLQFIKFDSITGDLLKRINIPTLIIHQQITP